MIPLTKVRQSNMELLRIIAMFLIVLYHVCLYVLSKYEGQYPLIKSVYTLSHIGVILFVLISGYFGIKSSISGLAKIYFSMVFYNVILYVCWIKIGHNTVDKIDVVKLFLPFTHSAPWLWFMKTYVMLYILSPLLNKARDFKSAKLLSCVGGGNILILTCLGVVLFWFGWLNHNNDLYDGRNIIEFAFLYLLGACYHDRVVITDENRLRYRRIFLWSYIVLCVVVGVVLYFVEGSLLDLTRNISHPYSSPIMIAMASLLFLLFTTFQFKSRFVNWAAGAVLAVYLVHENKYFDFIPMYQFIEYHFIHDSALLFIALLIATILVLMLASILIDKVRIETWKLRKRECHVGRF